MSKTQIPTGISMPKDRETTRLSRRLFLQGSALFLASPLWLSGCSEKQSTESNDWFISGSDDAKGNHHLSVFDTHGKSILALPVKQRVHGQAINPANKDQVVFFARRPGTEAYVLDIKQRRLKSHFQAGENRHFFGHGTFSQDGNYLYSCENDYTEGAGVIVVRDTTTWQTLSEFPAYGIGTHQIAMMPDGKHIVAANGGIQTHPDFPRKKLNIDTMKPSLTYIEIESGKHIESYHPTHHQMSIRHLDVGADGTVGIAMQYQGSKFDIVPLIAFHKGEDQLQYAQASRDFWQGMKQYTASIALDSKSHIAAVTTPRGNNITFWDIKSKGLLHKEPMEDVAGVVFSQKQQNFIATTGLGDVFSFAKNSLIRAKANHQRFSNTRWDNHMSLISS